MTELDLSSLTMTKNPNVAYLLRDDYNIKRLTLGTGVKFNNTTSALPTGTYWERESTKAVYKASVLASSYTSSMADVYTQLPILDVYLRDEEYRSDGTLSIDNVWEYNSYDDTFTAYCMNLDRNGVGEYLTKEKINDDEDLEGIIKRESISSSEVGRNLGSNMREALITLMYFGYPNDYSGIRQRYGLSAEQYRNITQTALHDFTDRGDNAIGTTMYTGSQLSAYNELMSKTFTDITEHEELELYVFKSEDTSKQNLLSITGIKRSTEKYGGVQVYKGFADNPNPSYLYSLKGATFTIFDSANNEVTKIISNDQGVAGIFKMDSENGLPPGTYTIKETTAPNGYELTDDYYTFTITNDQEIVNTGKLNGTGSNVQMIFSDLPDSDYKGGGVRVKKSSATGQLLANTEFTIYDSNYSEVTKIITDETGIASTGIKELPITNTAGTTYYIKETKAPKGYNISDTSYRRFVLKNDSAYYETVLEFTDEKKTGSVSFSATKELITDSGNISLSDLLGLKFGFKLVDQSGAQVGDIKYTDANGKVEFTLNYTADDLGFHNYQIVEVANSAKDSNNQNTTYNITYDTHKADVIVYVNDNGGDSLDCNASYSSEAVKFTNKVKYKEVYTPASVTVTKTDGTNTISGAAFTLYSDSSCTTEVENYSNVGSFTISTEDNKIKSKLRADKSSTTLYLKETLTPPGYNGSTRIYPIVITSDVTYGNESGAYQKTTKYTMKIDGYSSAEVVNGKRTRSDIKHDSVTIKKIDSATEQEIGGENKAVFTLYADSELNRSITTYEGGSFEIKTEDLSSSYLPQPNETVYLYLKETKAPKGYTASNVVPMIKISASQREYLDTTENK
ncbi:MAG: thioester-forming surface-anchored protein, partial [Clostridia bacterium]|nr:thioester-forming surface-anchored protein [Clostridia bacterium]